MASCLGVELRGEVWARHTSWGVTRGEMGLKAPSLDGIPRE